MAIVWKEAYSNEKKNAEISASATEDFAVDLIDQANKKRYGSMNQLVVNNDSNYTIELSLDGSTYALLASKTSVIIDPDAGKFFNLIRITNTDSGNAVPASSVSVRWARNTFTVV